MRLVEQKAIPPDAGKLWQTLCDQGILTPEQHCQLARIAPARNRRTVSGARLLPHLTLSASECQNFQLFLRSLSKSARGSLLSAPCRIIPSIVGRTTLSTAHCATPAELLSTLERHPLWTTIEWLSYHLPYARHREEITTRLGDHLNRPRLRVLSYNVWGLTNSLLGVRRMLAFGAHTADRYPKIGESLRRLSPDIVALQEMWDPRTDAICSSAGYTHAAQSDGGFGLVGKTGLMTLSRFPILESATFRFADSIGVERAVRKGALFTRMRMSDGGEVEIFNVHLISPAENLNHLFVTNAAISAVRLRQIAQLAEWMRRVHRPGSEVVICGDFNANEGGAEYRAMVSTFGSDLFRARHRRVPSESGADAEERCGVTYDTRRNFFAMTTGDGVPQRYDYLFSPTLTPDRTAASCNRVFVLQAEQFSDHYGVVCDLHFRGSNAELPAPSGSVE